MQRFQPHQVDEKKMALQLRALPRLQSLRGVLTICATGVGSSPKLGEKPMERELSARTACGGLAVESLHRHRKR